MEQEVMSEQAHPSIQAIDRLADVYRPFAEKMAEYRRVAARDMRAAELVFAEAQEIGRAFHAGAEYAQLRGPIK